MALKFPIERPGPWQSDPEYIAAKKNRINNSSGLEYGTYTTNTQKLMDEGLIDDSGNFFNISLPGYIAKLFGSETPITNAPTGLAARFDGLNDQEVLNRLISPEGALSIFKTRPDYETLIRYGMLQGPDGVIKPPTGKHYADDYFRKTLKDMRANPGNYSLTSNMKGAIERLRRNEKAKDIVGTEKAEDSKTKLGDLGSAVIGGDVTGSSGDYYPTNEIAKNSYFDATDGVGKIVVELNEENADVIKQYKPKEYEAYLEALALPEGQERNRKLPQAIKRLTNGTGNVTLIDDMFEDHYAMLRDAEADNSGVYAGGQLLQLGIEFIPGIGLFGASGIKKGIQAGAYLLRKTGEKIPLAFIPGTSRLSAASKANLLENGIDVNNPKILKEIELRNAEAVVRKLRFDPETGKMNITDPNVANMSKTDNFDDVPSLDVGKKSSLSPALLANQEVKDMPTDMAAFWKKSQELEVYKDKKWTDLSAQQRANFKKKYDRFAEKNISVDDIVITRDKKRLIYPETYNTKSLYPYSPSHEPVAGGSRIRSSGVEFSHLENGKEIEKRFDEMVRNFYEYPMNSKNVPEEFNIESFNKFFFGGEKSDDYVSSMVSAYARDKGITRPVIGTDDFTKYKQQIKNADIKENGNYTFENKISGDTEINLHHSATKKKPYTSDDLMYIDSFVNQEVLESSEKARNKLLNKQKIALNKYIANPNASNKKVLIEMNDEFLEIIGNENTYGLLSAPLANFKGSNVFLSEFKFTSPSLKKLDTTGIFKGKNIKDLNLLEQVILDFNRPLKKVDDKGSLIKGKGKLLTNKQFVSQFEDTIEGPLDASIDYLVNRKTVKTDPFFRAQQKTYLQQNPGKNADDAIDAIKKYIKEEAVKQMKEFGIFQVYKDGGEVRKGFATGTRDGALVGDNITGDSIYGQYLTNLNLSMDKKLREREDMDRILNAPKSMQNAVAMTLFDDRETEFLEEIRQMPNSVRADFKQKVLDAQEVQKSLAETLRDPRPVKFPIKSIPKLLTDNVLLKSAIKNQMYPTVVFKSFLSDLMGKEGPENAQVIAPNVFDYINLGPTPSTADEAKYIDGIDEFNRALETGVTNIGFSVMDLILGGVDLGTGNNFALTEKLQKLYDEKGINEPETFIGDMTALLVEFGVPGGVVSKLLTRAQKAMRLNGVNTMTRYLDPDLTGSAKRAIQFTNLASRVGTGAVVFGATDFIAGGPNNSLKRMFPDDSTLLPGKPERTDDLTGGDLVAANFRNRLRFAADGALIGAAFPLVGPPLYGVIKGTAKLPFKTIPGIDRSVVGGTLQLAGVPLRIAADVLAGKIPYTQTMIPAVGKAISKTGEKTASAIQATAAFVGKNVFARAALASQDAMFFRDSIYSGINRGTTFARGLPKVFGGEGGGLPSFQEWRKFSVNSADPLHANLARIDNKLAMFRDIGKLTKDAFALSTKSQNFIKAKSRTIDKLYTNLEQITYRLAKKFEEQHKQWGQFDIIQKKYLDDVLDYLKGNKKIENIDPPLRDAALELKEYYRKLMNEFKDLLPDGDKLKTLLTQDIDSQMKRSFAAFTNSNFRPGAENVKAARDYIANFIKQDTSLQAEAKLAFPNAKNLDEAINSLAELKVADLMHVARYEMEDPIRALRKITGKLETSGVRGLVDPLEIFTGQELPAVIRQLMGEEKNLKNSLMQTTGNIIASTQQKEALDRIAKLGLENGWLFNSADDALTKGKIIESIPVGDIKGAGFLPSDILGLHGTPEMVKQLSGYSIFDSALKYKFYQNLLAFKAMVQGGKTLYSPATQMRNFGSAGLFAMNVGHIGGKTSVTQNFKIMLDDIFGSGPGVNQSDLIKFIERKIELGVLDENVVAQELGGVLRDLKGVIGKDGKPVISNFNNLTQRIGDAKLSQTVQRLYAGGDNVWKAYGHEFYMSELKQFTKSLDDVSNFFRTQVGREWEPMKNGVKKTLAEGIEEMAAHLLRETYPTYSRVPPAIQALRKLPIGNFISFPAEMIRTSLATTSSAMKMIGSGNPGLQAMGYRALMGQFTTLYGFNHGAQKLASKMTGVGEDKLRAYQDDLGPSFIDDHILVPITKQKEDGTFKAFDASTYNPYNYLVGPVEQFIRELGSTRLDPAQVDSELDRRFFDAAGPFMKLLDPFIGETIALEPIMDIYARNGVTRDGKKIFSPLDSPSDKREKSIYHLFETIAPGFVRSASQIYGALTLDTKGGRVMELGDVLIRLMGGSIMNIDPVTALDYKAIDIRQIRGAAFQTEAFFSKENALSRGPILDEKGRQVGHVMANELRDIQEEAFVAQFGIWKMFHKSLASGLLTEEQIKSVLGKKGRNVPNLKKLMDGEFTPVSVSKSGLKNRANDLVEEYEARGIDVNYEDLYPYYDLLEVINEFKYRRFEDFLDPARPPLDEIPLNLDFISQTPTPPTPDIPVAPLDTSDFADTQIAAAPKQTVVGANNQQVNNQTGLTRNEEALLSPSDRFYRRSQRGKI